MNTVDMLAAVLTVDDSTLQKDSAKSIGQVLGH